jgi:hypothetical protein
VQLEYVIRDDKGMFDVEVMDHSTCPGCPGYKNHNANDCKVSNFHFELLPDGKSVRSGLESNELLSGSRKERTKKYIQSRKEACCNDHPECRSTNWWRSDRNLDMSSQRTPRNIAGTLAGEAEELWQPTRLLAISEADDQKPTEVRLVETQGDYYGPYIALSYSWGGVSSKKLEQSIFAEFAAGISCHYLPRTFQDAIEVALWLGLKHIWIDSLCIIQDSTEDWAHEAIQMHRVYQSAELTISASAANNSQDGLFFETQTIIPNFVHGLQLPGLNLVDYQIVDCQLWTANVVNGPLIRRAWTVQERMLSRRILHFGKEQVFFQCARQLECESYPADTARYGANRDNPHGFSLLDKRGPPDSQSYFQCAMHIRIALRCRVPEDFRKIWHQIVRIYSSCEMTYQTDKLVAIGSLAKWLHTWHGFQYYAGLWEDNMIFQLCWWVQNYRQAKRPDQYVAPSWSWASVIGTVELGHSSLPFRTTDVIYLAKITDVQIQKTSVTSFGQIQGGYLTIIGNLKQLTIRKTPKQFLSAYEVQCGHQVMSSSPGFRTLKIHLDLYPGTSGQHLSFLPLWLWFAYEGGDGRDRGIENDIIYGLLLASVQGEPRKHSRVGIMMISRTRYQRLWGDIPRLTHVSEVSHTYDGSDVTHDGLETITVI